jgi:hypothetical protein
MKTKEMKKIIFSAIILAVQLSYSQNVFPTSGNVGIGTTAPKQKLTIVGNYNAIDQGAPTNGQNSTAILRLQSSAYGPGEVLDFGMNIKSYGWIQPQDYNDPNAFYNLILNAKGGNIGIGTVNPTSKLESVNTIAGITSFKSMGINGYLLIDNVGSGENYYSANKFQEFQINGVPKMRINSDGNVGIGTTSPTNKLDVNGTIHSKEVKVDMNGWSDFVFKKEYKLPTLEEVEKHIIEKGYIENIPSEEEVLKDGINLGEMNSKLLQKIEEMTLYMIQQNKAIEELRQEIKNIKS